MFSRGRSAVGAFLLSAGAVLAHSGTHGVVKERMDGMKAMSDATKAIGAVKVGMLPYSAELMRRAAGELILNGEAARALFPEGAAAAGESEASPVIWTEREGFDQLLNDLIEAAERLDAAAEDEATALRVADEIAATCKDCHAKYREKKL